MATTKCGPIETGVLYPLQDAMDRLGLGRRAMREARIKGLRVIRMGNRGYLLGEDILDFFRVQGEQANAGGSTQPASVPCR